MNETKAAKSATITLKANGSTMRIIALRKADETATTFVTTQADGAKKSVRGLTEQHANMDAAKARLSVLAAEAEKAGWKRPTVGRAFVAKPDAFSALPAPPKAAKAK